MDYFNPNDAWMRHDDYQYTNLTEQEQVNRGCMQSVVCFIAFIIGILICSLFSSCTTTQYVPVIEHRTDTLIQAKVQHDSIHVKDSTIVEKGDSIIKIEHWHVKYVEKQVHDTTYISKTDTVPEFYPVIREVTLKRTTMEWVLMIAGMLAIIGVIVWVVNKIKRLLPGT